MPRLVIVSNRVPDLDGLQLSGGGLAVAVLDALRDNGGLWFGWNGLIAGDGDSLDVAVNEHDTITIATVPLSKKDYEDYYLGFSNSVIWPVFHNRLDLAKFSATQVEGYRRVNMEFANRLSPLLRPSDLIWIHDYHLIPLAAHLRVHGHRNPIGFFLHISFPTPDILVAAPEHEWLMDSFLSYDLVGFQTALDADNFHRFLLNFEGTSQSENKLVHGDALSSLESSPSASTSRPLPPWRTPKRLRNALNGCTEERLHACTLSVWTGSITRRVCLNGYMRLGDCWNSILKTERSRPSCRSRRRRARMSRFMSRSERNWSNFPARSMGSLETLIGPPFATSTGPSEEIRWPPCLGAAMLVWSRLFGMG